MDLVRLLSFTYRFITWSLLGRTRHGRVDPTSLWNSEFCIFEHKSLDENFYPMNVNEARIFTTPALHAKSTRKDVLRKLTFHFKPKLKVFNQTKYLIQNINRHIKRILLFLKLLAILYVVTFVVFIGFTVLQIAIYHFRLAVHMTYSVLLCHDDDMSIPGTETLYDYWITTYWGTRAAGHDSSMMHCAKLKLTPWRNWAEKKPGRLWGYTGLVGFCYFLFR